MDEGNLCPTKLSPMHVEKAKAYFFGIKFYADKGCPKKSYFCP